MMRGLSRYGISYSLPMCDVSFNVSVPHQGLWRLPPLGVVMGRRRVIENGIRKIFLPGRAEEKKTCVHRALDDRERDCGRGDPASGGRAAASLAFRAAI